MQLVGRTVPCKHTEEHPTQKKWSINFQTLHDKDCQYQYFSIMFFLSHKSRRIGVLIRNFLVRKKSFRSLFFCPIRVGLTAARFSLLPSLRENIFHKIRCEINTHRVYKYSKCSNSDQAVVVIKQSSGDR